MTSTRPGLKSHGARILALVSDAHGGFGGISQYNRDALEAMCGWPTVAEVHVLPRKAALPLPALEPKLTYHLGGLSSPLSFMRSAVVAALTLRSVDLIYCGHINLMPAALAVARLKRAPIVLAVYGIDVWQPVTRTPVALLRSSMSAVISISEITRDCFHAWCPLEPSRTFIVPNAIKLENYGCKPRNAELMARYGLAGRTVLMTLGRMESEERLKGFDRILEVLPRLRSEIANIAYLAVGDGNDRARLERKAADLGVTDTVIFTGRIPDGIKSDVYGLADVYVMPSKGEGFGFVVLEAMAAGLPVVVSACDGTREAVRGGELGIVVDPDDLDAIRRGILEALQRPRSVPAGLDYFTYERFSERLRSALSSVCAV